MATITKSIGTTSRDYSTITLWEADLDNGAVYSASDDALGECYDDTAFDEDVVINGGDTIGLTGIVLSVASGQRHDGTAGTGARNVSTSTFRNISCTEDLYTLEWLEIDGGGFGGTDGLAHDARTSTERNSQNIYKQLLIHSASRTGTQNGINIDSGGVQILNCIVYDIECDATGSQGAFGIDIVASTSTRITNIHNCTIHNIVNNGGTGNAWGIGTQDSVYANVNNCVVTDVTGTASGTVQCFENAAPANAPYSYNMTSDTSSSGTGSQDSITTANQYVSTTGGSEDLHIQDTAADIYEAGTDLGTTPTDVQFDIDNYDRDTGATTWSIGAHDGNNLRGGSSPVALTPTPDNNIFKDVIIKGI